MSSDKLAKYYSYLLILGAAYHFFIFLNHYDGPYKIWLYWAGPDYSTESYVFLFFTYSINIATPLIMLLAGRLLFKNGKFKWYVGASLVIFLLLSGFVGKLTLLVGMGAFGANKFYYAKST